MYRSFAAAMCFIAVHATAIQSATSVRAKQAEASLEQTLEKVDADAKPFVEPVPTKVDQPEAETTEAPDAQVDDELNDDSDGEYQDDYEDCEIKCSYYEDDELNAQCVAECQYDYCEMVCSHFEDDEKKAVCVADCLFDYCEAECN